jgi:hypothetical protein
MSGVFRSECDAFIKVLCDFNPYFNHIFRYPVWVEDQLQMHREEVGWKNILLRIMTDGDVLYSSSLTPQDDSEWLTIGNMHECSYCAPHVTPDKPAALQLTFESKCNKLQTTWIFNAGTTEACEAWLNRFCMKCPSDVLNVRFDSIGEYGDAVSTMDLHTSTLIRGLINRTVAAKRKHNKDAHQLVANAASKGKAATYSGALANLAPLSIDASVFVAYGSAFRTNGKGVGNDEGCLLLSLSAHDWGRLKRRQIEHECDQAIQVLCRVPILARASQKDMQQLALQSYVTNFAVGEVTAGASLSSRHIHIIRDGVCKLRRPRQKENHYEKVHKHAMASRGALGGATLGMVKLDCPTCFGGGVSGAIPAISDRIKLCRTCSGLGYVVQDEEEKNTDVGELRTGVVLSEAIARGDSIADYEIIGCSPLQLLSVKLELWMDLKYKWEKLGTGMPHAHTTSISNVTESLLNNARAVRVAVKKGNVKHYTKCDRFVKKLSLEEKAKRLVEKTHSARMQEIDQLMNVERLPPADILVSSKSQVAPAVLLCAPPNTIKNRFAGSVPRLNLEPILGDDMRGVFLTNLPVTERFLGPSTLKSAHLIPSKSGAQTARFMDSTATIKLKPLSRPATQANGDVAETQGGATLRSRPDRLEKMGYAPKVTLKYGNAFKLDDRQKHLYKIMQEMLSESNYADLSSDASHMSTQGQGPKAPAPNSERTVDVFEFYGALERYKLLAPKVTDERVMHLHAVCKADATRIFKKVTKNEQGNQDSRMSMVKFHEAVQLVAKVLQVPLNGMLVLVGLF